MTPAGRVLTDASVDHEALAAALAGTGVTVADYPIEILDASEHGIKTVRVFPPGSQSPPKVAA